MGLQPPSRPLSLSSDARVHSVTSMARSSLRSWRLARADFAAMPFPAFPPFFLPIAISLPPSPRSLVSRSRWFGEDLDADRGFSVRGLDFPPFSTPFPSLSGLGSNHRPRRRMPHPPFPSQYLFPHSPRGGTERRGGPSPPGVGGGWISTCGFPATQATSTDDGIANFVERRTLGRAFSRPWRAPEGVEGRVGRTGGKRWRLRPNGGWQDGVARRTPRPPPATRHGGAAVVLRTHREMREAESPQDRP